MKTRDLKRRINSSLRTTYKSNKKLENKFKREVLNPLLRHLRSKGVVPEPEEVKLIANHLLYQSEIYFPFTEELFDLEIKDLRMIGNRFLKEMERIKQGKKVKPKRTSFIIATKTQLKTFNYEEAILSFEETLRNQLSLLRSDLQSHALSIEKSLIKKLETGIDKVSFEGKGKTKLITQLRNSLQKQVKNYIKFITANKALEAFNKGDDMAARVTSRVAGLTMTKKWVTRFDNKVRNWHDRINFQTRRLHDLFDVPYPGGTDRLVAPKIPPISGANYFNCRCVVAYKVLKKG